MGPTNPTLFNGYRMYNIVLMLRDSEHYAGPLKREVVLSDFDHPADQDRLSRLLVHLIRDEDIVDGFIDVSDRSSSPEPLGDQARARFAVQSKAGEIDFKVRNLRGSPKVEVEPLPSDPAGDFSNSVCVVGLISVEREMELSNDLQGWSHIKSALNRVAYSHQDSWSHLYLYYMPDEGEFLDKEEAERLFDAIRATVSPQNEGNS